MQSSMSFTGLHRSRHSRCHKEGHERTKGFFCRWFVGSGADQVLQLHWAVEFLLFAQKFVSPLCVGLAVQEEVFRVCRRCSALSAGTALPCASELGRLG